MPSTESLEIAGLGRDVQRVADAIEGLVHEQHTANLIALARYGRSLNNLTFDVGDKSVLGVLRERMGVKFQ